MTEYRPPKLINLLEQEISWIDSLISLLAEEKETLIARQFEALEDLANRKQMLSDNLEQSARLRIELLETAQHNNQPKLALEAFLLSCSADETNRINSLNSKLAERLKTCRELNSVNGQVIATNINTRQEIINSLTGQSNNEALSIYTAAGNVKAATDTGRHQEA